MTERRLAQTVFVLLCVEAIFSLPYRSVYLLRQSAHQAWIAALCVLALVSLAFVFRQSLLRALARLVRFPSISSKVWLSFWLLFGVALRLAWALRFPVTFQSDNQIYFAVASDLAHGLGITSVFNPPGFSLFLAPFLFVFGAHTWVALLCALVAFVATYLLTYALAQQMQGGLAARIAPMLVAIWPCYFPLAGVNSKETLLAALVPATLFFYLKATGSRAGCSNSDPTINSVSAPIHWGYMVAAGLCMGFASLTQPGYMLFPAVLFAFEMLCSRRFLRAAGRTVIFSLFMLAAILPWTYKNYRTFHRVVLISTNGGSVFYRANNPHANAQYEPESQAPLPKDEFEANKLGYQLAEDWIEHNPGAFTVLMVRKQVVFLGDDALGAFETLKKGNYSSRLYAAFKAGSNFFWLALWIVLLLGFPLLFRLRNWRLWFGLLFLPLLYQWSIDSVFESGPRHHVPYAPLIAVMVGMVLGAAVRPQSTSAQLSPD